MSSLCGQLENIGQHHHRKLAWTTLFSMNPTPVTCRSSIEGVWRFTYSVGRYTSHKCRHPRSNLTACPDPGNRFSTENRFYISYGACDDFSWKKDDPGMLFTKDTCKSCTNKLIIQKGLFQLLCLITSRTDVIFEVSAYFGTLFLRKSIIHV